MSVMDETEDSKKLDALYHVMEKVIKLKGLKYKYRALDSCGYAVKIIGMDVFQKTGFLKLGEKMVISVDFDDLNATVYDSVFKGLANTLIDLARQLKTVSSRLTKSPFMPWRM